MSKRTDRKSRKSLFTSTVLLRIQAFVTGADGVITAPEGGIKGYSQGLFDRTPAKPKLVVIAVKTEIEGAGIEIGITNRKGVVTHSFTISGQLTDENAEETGRSVARLLKDRGSAAMCGRRLRELTQEPVDSKATFSVGSTGRMQITAGGDV